MATRTAVGWALLFSVPPGVGVTGYAAMVAGGGTVGSTALATGGLAFAVIFLLVLGSQQVGSAEPADERERID